jgi:peptidoglycan L-alanyl-D-glutamate endopeptidase CwlK
MRQRHGFWALTPWEATKKPITWTLKSKHLVGKAFDACPVRNGKAWWGAPQDVWDKMGEIGESVGLKWGGRWKNKDSPHFEEP